MKGTIPERSEAKASRYADVPQRIGIDGGPGGEGNPEGIDLDL